MLQYSLPGFEMALADHSHTAIGMMGERWLMTKLAAQGLHVSLTQPGERRGDLRVVNPSTGEVRLVEVKTARKGRDGKWRFTLVKKGHTDHRRADVIVLLAVTASGKVIPFIVPVSDLAAKHHAVITSHPAQYAGRLAKYRCAPGARMVV